MNTLSFPIGVLLGSELARSVGATSTSDRMTTGVTLASVGWPLGFVLARQYAINRASVQAAPSDTRPPPAKEHDMDEIDKYILAQIRELKADNRQASFEDIRAQLIGSLQAIIDRVQALDLEAAVDPGIARAIASVFEEIGTAADKA
ncbi:hypothetical protein [Lysobacter terrae]